MDALALAYTSDKKNRKILESAYNVSSDLGRVSKILAKQGLKTVSAIKIELFIPIRPMLAERVQTSKEALEKVSGRNTVNSKARWGKEYKFIGEIRRFRYFREAWKT
jgi:DNA ligase-1